MKISSSGQVFIFMTLSLPCVVVVVVATVVVELIGVAVSRR